MMEHEQHYGRLPKTLIFAANDLSHTSYADQLVDLARDIFGRGDSFAQKIAGKSVSVQHTGTGFHSSPAPFEPVTGFNRLPGRPDRV
jgi:type I restriction enzyme R subunit